MIHSHSFNSEVEKVLVNFNNTGIKYDKSKSIIQMFEEQVERTPFADAVIYNNGRLSYKELNEKANILGSLLRKKDRKSLEDKY